MVVDMGRGIILSTLYVDLASAQLSAQYGVYDMRNKQQTLKSPKEIQGKQNAKT